ncbi:HYR domain-containing protein [Fulvivirga maritima]|uniref:HYR domain-containing protein n=1 Tax=Fulvivirga maritima TaxID=2904247 RepID=UPI001F4543B5|nr:HYR domain-containing protein [Fulvivirga maritima]UII26705.1 HYR domain-containing protein [Fulvivirga maritima]
MTTVGDINDDGFNDIAVSAYLRIGSIYTSRLHVIYGRSSFSREFEISSLDGSNGFMVGLSRYGPFGGDVAYGGDINGDAIDDFIIGNYAASDVDGTYNGAAYVIYGSNNPGDFPADYDLTTLDGSNGFVMRGREGFNDRLGTGVSIAGDVNNDGIDDLLISGRSAGRANGGAAYVLYGTSGAYPAEMILDDYVSDPNHGFQVFYRVNYPTYGIAVDALGDVNEDGYDDFIIGSSTSSTTSGVAIVYGNTFDLDDDIAPTITCPSSSQSLFEGSTLPSYVSEINASDNCTYIEDLVISQSPPRGTLFTGAVEVTMSVTDGSGNTTSCSFMVNEAIPNADLNCNSTSINYENLDGTDGFKAEGVKTTSQFGNDIEYVGDFNGDGIDDFIVGARGVSASFGGEYNNQNIVVEGNAFLVYGRSTGFEGYEDMALLDGTNRFVIGDFSNLYTSSQYSGYAVAGIGDINGDGLADIAIGDPFQDCGLGNECGFTFVIFGSSTFSDAQFDYADLDGTNGFILSGEQWVQSGMEITSVNLNGDNYDDLVVAARSGSGSLDGKAYVVYGKGSTFDAMISYADLDGTNGFVLEGPSGGEISLHLSNAGDLNGDGLEDLAVISNQQVYVIYGSTTQSYSSTYSLDNLDASSGVVITNSSGSLSNVFNAGDINDSGYEGLFVSEGSSYYAIFGGAIGAGVASFDVADLDGTNGFSMTGFRDLSYSKMQGGGDFNGDGIDDFVVRNKVVFGRSTWPNTITSSGLHTGEYFNTVSNSIGSVAIAGDINNDGISDVISGARYLSHYTEDSQFNEPGEIYVIFGYSPTDEAAPEITCLKDQEVNYGDSLVDYTSIVTVTDACDPNPTIEQSPAPDSVITVSTKVTITATDASGNKSTCSFIVAPIDEEAPEITCLEDQEVACDVTTLPDYLSQITVTDNIDPDPEVTQSPGAGTAFTAGMTVTITATDSTGNSSNCSFEVDLKEDTVAPEITCLEDREIEGGSSLLDYTSLATVSDVCDDDPEITQSPAAGATITVATEVTLTATDASGNIGTCSFIVTPVFTDTEAPEITCLDDQEVACDVTTLPDYLSQITVTDNMDADPEVTQSPAAGSALTDGMTVNITATDSAGNSSHCSFDVNLSEDTTAPTITCIENQEVEGGSSLLDYTSLATVSDVCDDDPDVTQSPAAGATITVATEVTLSATDASGNIGTCSFMVTPVFTDSEAPEITCLEDQEVACDITTLPDYLSQITVTDNMDADPEVTQSPAAGSALTDGMTVNITATDADGNASTCAFVVHQLEPELEAGDNVQIVLGNSTTLNAEANMPGSFQWSPINGLSNPESSTTTASPQYTTDYTLQFVSEEGCEVYDYLTIEVVEGETKYGLSPDGDGINDRWVIHGIEDYPENKVSIYNRWGDLVFEMEGYDNQGHSFTGQANRLTGLGAGDLPEGTYFFKIMVPADHQLEKTNGYLVLKK